MMVNDRKYGLFTSTIFLLIILGHYCLSLEIEETKKRNIQVEFFDDNPLDDQSYPKSLTFGYEHRENVANSQAVGFVDNDNGDDSDKDFNFRLSSLLKSFAKTDRLSTSATEWSQLAKGTSLDDLRQLRDRLNSKTGGFVSAGCLSDLLYVLDAILGYTMSQNDVSNFCRLNSSQMDCECANKTLRKVDQNSWAFNVLDSFGKFPAGFAKGNFWMIGDYEQCTGISVSKDKFRRMWQGRYSRADFYLYKNEIPELLLEDEHKTLFPNIDGHGLFMALPSNLPNCNVFLHLKIGMCFPATCSKTDVQKLVDFAVGSLQKMSKKKLVCSSELLYHSPPNITEDTPAMLVLIFIMVVLCFVVFGTCYDYNVHKKITYHWSYHMVQSNQKDVVNGFQANFVSKLEEPSNLTYDLSQPKFIQFLLAFSIYSNFKKIFNLKSDKGAGHITCLDGLKATSILWILLAHTYSCGILFVDNPLDALKLTDYFYNHIILNATLAVDAFFVMTGLLLSYLWLKEGNKTNGRNVKNPIAWLWLYLHRYIRLTPVYAVVLFLQIFVVKYLYDGPMASPHGLDAAECRQNWWSNLLYVNNIIHTNPVCMVWTWYLANDTQFFVVTPPLLMILWMNKAIGLALILTLILGSSLLRGFLLLSNDALPPISILFNDMDKIQIFEQHTRDIYIKPYCRIGPFLVGILLGYILYKNQLKAKISKWTNIICWMFSIATLLGVLFGIYDFAKTGQINLYVKLFYGSFCRVLWAVAVAYIIYACATGHGGLVNRFLSLAIWKPISRLVYSAYLIHPMIILMYGAASMKPMHYMGHYHMIIFYYFPHVFLSFVLAFILSCCFEMPILHLERLILHKNRRESKYKNFETVTAQQFNNTSSLQSSKIEPSADDKRHDSLLGKKTIIYG